VRRLNCGPDMCREQKCKQAVLYALEERWNFEDAWHRERIRLEEGRRRLGRYVHFGEASLMIGLTFMALGYGLASVDAPDDIVVPYLGIGLLLSAAGLILIAILAVYGWTKLVDRFAERTIDYFISRRKDHQ